MILVNEKVADATAKLELEMIFLPEPVSQPNKTRRSNYQRDTLRTNNISFISNISFGGLRI